MTIIYPIIYTLEDSYSYSIRAAVPIRYNCLNLPPGFLSADNDGWNCNLCGSDSDFFAPYEPGDIIPFQTRVADNYNNPASVLSFGIKTVASGVNNFMVIELQDCCGLAVTDFVNEFAEDWWVSYSLQFGSIQTWFVNTGLFPTNLKCFRFKIVFYKIDQITLLPQIERTIYTEYYKEVAECGSDVNTVLIESTYQSTDCNGNWYGAPTNYFGNSNRQFYNSLRVFGDIQFTGDVPATTENDIGTIISTTVTNNFRITSTIYPPYFVRRLQQTLRGKDVTGDGNIYQNWTFSSLDEGFKMFAIDIEMNQKCFIDNRQCNF